MISGVVRWAEGKKLHFSTDNCKFLMEHIASAKKISIVSLNSTRVGIFSFNILYLWKKTRTKNSTTV